MLVFVHRSRCVLPLAVAYRPLPARCDALPPLFSSDWHRFPSAASPLSCSSLALLVQLLYVIVQRSPEEKAFRARRRRFNAGALAAVAAVAASPVFTVPLPVLVVNDKTGAQHCGTLQLPRLATPAPVPPSAAVLRMTSLESLTIDHCLNLKTVPASIGQLGTLKHLTIRHLHKLEEMPDTLGRMTSLESLTIHYCPELKTVPAASGKWGHSSTSRFEVCISWRRCQIPSAG